MEVDDLHIGTVWDDDLENPVGAFHALCMYRQYTLRMNFAVIALVYGDIIHDMVHGFSTLVGPTKPVNLTCLFWVVAMVTFVLSPCM
jgi:hypothetical protein